MARPLLKQEDLRRPVKCYFTVRELALIQEKAQQVGLPISTFIRETALNKRLISIPPINAEKWLELAHTTSNLNQIAAYLNRKADRANPGILPVLEKTLESTRQAISRIRSTMIGQDK